MRQVRFVLLYLSLLPASSWAQTPTQNVEVEPVTCWWRTDVSAVRVGQPFGLLLTCSILEAEAVRAIVDRSRLAPAAVQFSPYEVTAGTQSEDVTIPGRRFIQHAYRLRLISEDAFGADVPIPGLEVSYRIESRVGEEASVQGRELTYILRPLSVHVDALVPADATHIRESAVPTLDEIAAREARGTTLRVAGTVLFGLAGLFLLVSLVHALRRRAVGTTEARRQLSHGSILHGVGRELDAVRQQAAREGWTTELAARALAALRIAGSYLAGQPVAQRPAGQLHANGELVLRRRLPFGKMVAVSGAATPTTAGVVQSTAESEDLREAMQVLTAARYGREERLDSGRLDDAVERALRVTRRAASQYTWIAETTRSMQRSLHGWRKRAWAR